MEVCMFVDCGYDFIGETLVVASLKGKLVDKLGKS